DHLPGLVPRRIPGTAPGQVPGAVPDHRLGHLPGSVPGPVPDRAQGRVPGRRLGWLLARVLLAGLAVPLWLAGCASPHRPAASPHDQAVPVWRDFVRCARTHGAPNLPDPVVDDHGRAVWPSDALARVPDPAHRRVMDTCSDVLQRLPASALEQ